MTPSHLTAATMLALATVFIAAAPAPAQSGPRGLPDCPNPVTDWTYCHIADLSHPALDSTTVPGSRRAIESVIATTANPVRLCWLGHYADRANPASINESFQIRIFEDHGSFPHLANGPIFTRIFEQNGVAGVNRLEMSCLDGQNCPGVADPESGGLWIYSAEISGGFPIPHGCYWVEIANVASAAAGVSWAWSASTYGIELQTLHGIDGNYVYCDRTLYDRAICLSGGVSPFIGPCSTGPTSGCPRIYANGQPPSDFCVLPNPPLYSRSSSPGSIGGATWHPALRADNFRFAQDRAVSGLCFFGAWYCPSGDGFCDPPPSVGTWDIVYYTDSGGIPGGEIASFRVGTTPGVTFLWNGWHFGSVDHPPVNFQAGQCYWLSVGRVQSGEGTDYQWAWAHTLAGTVGDGAFATNVNGQWHQSRLAGDVASFSNLAFILSDGPVTSPTCEPHDCNGNGSPDTEDIAANPSLDCYTPAGPPGVMGGPDGALDSCQCIADWTRDGAVNSSDISGFLTSWIGAVNAPSSDADLDCSGVTNSTDISAFLTAWLASVVNPAAQGCP